MWCEAGFNPDTFEKQTAATFAASLRGKAKARADQAKREMWLAWHTGAFAGAAFNGALKPLKHYLSEGEPVGDRRIQHANGIAFFHRLRAAGVPVKIDRMN